MIQRHSKPTLSINIRLLVTLFSLMIPNFFLYAQSFYQVEKLLTTKQHNQLQKTLSQKFVRIKRQAQAKKGYHFTQPRVHEGRAVLLTDQVLLTSSQWLLPQPDEAPDIMVTTQCRNHTIYSHHEPIKGIVTQWVKLTNNKKNDQHPSLTSFSVHYHDLEGWALIYLPKKLPCPPIKYRLNKLKNHFYIGSSVYAYEPAPKRLARLTLQGHALPPMHYFWLINGVLNLPGTPLFDQDGFFVTFTAMKPSLSSSEKTAEHLSTLVFPPQAITNAIQQIKD